MNVKNLLLALAILSSTNLAKATEKDKSASTDSIKQGWNFGAIPAISYSTDVGFQYGAAVNFYHYGDGSRFPLYNHSFYVEISRYTKGSGTYRFYYDSDQFIKGIHITSDLSYLPDRAYDFYGFNGYESVYNKDWVDDTSEQYRTRMFYKFQQKLFRFKTDFQGQLGEGHFRWLAGVNLMNYNIKSVDIDKLNEGKDDEDKLPSVEEQPGLYERYQNWGLIDAEEADGGFIPELKAGLVYDTRDHNPNPMKGVWSEAVLAVVPGFLGADSGFSKFSLIHRQYFTLVKNDLSFAYRVAWQQTLSGDVPFYYQPNLITTVLTGSSTTGLGGSKNLRGANRNRVVGDGVLYGNLELRWKFARMRFIRQNFYWGLNGFYDFGMATRKIDMESKIAQLNRPEFSGEATNHYFNFGAEKLHSTVGAGLRLAMNYNFILALDYGLTLDDQDGASGIYIGLNYIF